MCHGSWQKSGQYQIESDAELAEFKPAEKFCILKSTPGTDLLNAFGMEDGTEGHEEQEGEETQHEMLLNAQSSLPIPSLPTTLELEELIDCENAQRCGMDSMVNMSDGKHIHKVKVLHEFTRFMKISNLTDHLRHVANTSSFTQQLPMQHHHIGDDSITETNCVLIQDPVAVLLQCNGIPFLGVAQVNSIKVNKSTQSVVSKDLLSEETITLGIQILHLKSFNIPLLNGRDGGWVWEHGHDASVIVTGKFVQQINPEIIEIRLQLDRRLMRWAAKKPWGGVWAMVSIAMSYKS